MSSKARNFEKKKHEILKQSELFRFPPIEPPPGRRRCHLFLLLFVNFLWWVSKLDALLPLILYSKFWSVTVIPEALISIDLVSKLKTSVAMEDAHRWNATYTNHIKQKRKIYHDGFLVLQPSRHKVFPIFLFNLILSVTCTASLSCDFSIGKLLFLHIIKFRLIELGVCCCHWKSGSRY